MGEDIYDFSGISFSDLSTPSSDSAAKIGGMRLDEDDEEWYPPTPPPYDVEDKLIEANQRLLDDPTSSTHVAGRLRWRPTLVDIRWLYPNDDLEQGLNSLSSSGGEEIVVIDGFESLQLNGDEDSSSESVSMRTSIEGVKAASHKNTSELKGKKGEGGEREEEEEEKCHDSEGYSEDDFEEDENSSCSSSPSATANYVPNGNNKSNDDGGVTIAAANSTSNKRPTSSKPKEKRNGGNNNHGSSPKVLSPYLNSDSSPTAVGHKPFLSSAPSQKGHNSSQARALNKPSPAKQKKKVTNGGGGSLVPERSGVKVSKQDLLKRPPHRGAKLRSSSLDKIDVSSKRDRSNSYSAVVPLTANGGSRKGPKALSDKRNFACDISSRRGGGISSSPSLPELNGHATKGMTAALSPPQPPPVIMPRGKSAAAVAARCPPPAKKTITFHNGDGGLLRSRSSLSAPPLLQRKISRNSLSSNSSLSSHSTEDSCDSLTARAQKETADKAYIQWRQRKREEKRLRERRAYLMQAQLRIKY